MKPTTLSGGAPNGRAITLVCTGLVLISVACGAPADAEPPVANEPVAAATGGAGGGSFSVGATTTSGPSGTGGSAAAGTGGAATTGGGGDAPVALDELGSLVVLGDSIGDGGGQGPYYYALLNDALAAHYGVITYRNHADSGSKTSALLGQVQALPASLPGPVAVTITSGGNDMKDNLLAILTGFDALARTQMGDNVDAALDSLLAPGRFGDGVAVHVFFATIYDASDGVGDYQSGGCAVNVNSPSSTDPFFESWNGEIAGRVVGHGQVVADMHGHFYGHGYHNPPKWYANDCTHPNTTGHAQLKELFFGLITGT